MAEPPICIILSDQQRSKANYGQSWFSSPNVYNQSLKRAEKPQWSLYVCAWVELS